MDLAGNLRDLVGLGSHCRVRPAVEPLANRLKATES